MARRSDHTRKELEKIMLDSADMIVSQDGFEGLSARKLADAIGYAPGTIYNVFQSMDDLCLRINAATLDALYDVLNAPDCNDPGQGPIENIKCMAGRYRAFCLERRPHWLMLFSHRLPAGQDVPEWYQEKIEKLFGPLEGHLRHFYKDRQARKRKMASRILWSSVHGLCFLEQTGKFRLVNDDMTIHDMIDYLIDCFISGLNAASPHNRL